MQMKVRPKICVDGGELRSLRGGAGEWLTWYVCSEYDLHRDAMKTLSSHSTRFILEYPFALGSRRHSDVHLFQPVRAVQNTDVRRTQDRCHPRRT
jgi:hypothetical protein